MSMGAATAAETFERVSKSVPAARRFLIACLERWEAEPMEWVAAQVLSELVTNAVLHADGMEITVVVRLVEAGSLRLEVTDASPRVPRLRHYGTQAATGRGIALVQGLCRAWGVERAAGGKVVWGEVGQGSGPGDLEDAAVSSLFPLDPEGLARARVPRGGPQGFVRVA